MQINKEKIGPTIKVIRQRLEMSQRRLAEESGLTVNYLSLLEHGKRGISLDQLNAVARVLGVPATVVIFLAADGGKRTGQPGQSLWNQLRTATEKAIELYLSQRVDPDPGKHP